LTGLACVSRIYSDVGVFSVGQDGAKVVEMAAGNSLDDLRAITGLELEMAAGR
jgi:3-oxoadipate CoA-transferase beta subunit